ncbi:unnamed protein product, partial [Oncorhynchus mykiss]
FPSDLDILIWLLLMISISITCHKKLRLVDSRFPLSFVLFQTLPDLKADNQRLKDENGALIRVISKLSK